MRGLDSHATVGNSVLFIEEDFPLTGEEGVVVAETPFCITVEFARGQGTSTWRRDYFAKLVSYTCGAV